MIKRIQMLRNGEVIQLRHLRTRTIYDCEKKNGRTSLISQTGKEIVLFKVIYEDVYDTRHESFKGVITVTDDLDAEISAETMYFFLNSLEEVPEDELIIF